MYSEATLWQTILGLMQYSLSKDHQHHKWQPQSHGFFPRLPGCAGQAADAVSAYTQVKMEDAHKLLKISKSERPDIWIRLPRHIWPKSWSSMEDPVVLLERNFYGHRLAWLLWERQCEKILLKYVWEKVSKLGMFSLTDEKGLFLSVDVDDIKLAGKKHNINPMWKVLNKEVDLGEPTSFLDHVYLGCTQKTMWNEQRYCGQLQNHVWIANFCGEIREITILSTYSYFFMVMWHGWSCKQKCGAILRVSKQDDSTTVPSYKRRSQIRGRMVKSMLSNCSEMLVLGTNWKTWYSMVGEQTSTIDHKMDKSLWQTIISFDLLHSSHKRIQTILSCGKHCQTLKIGTVSRLRFCGEILRIQNLHQVEYCASLWSSYICSCQLDVQETNFSFAQYKRIRNHFLGRRIERLEGIPALDLWDLIVEVLHRNTYQSNQERGNLCTNIRAVPHTLQKRKKSHGMIDVPQTSILLVRKLCMCLKTTKQWSRWLLREEARQWDMFPEPTELLLVGYSIESIWTPKSKSSTSIPRTNSHTC